MRKSAMVRIEWVIKPNIKMIVSWWIEEADVEYANNKDSETKRKGRKKATRVSSWTEYLASMRGGGRWLRKVLDGERFNKRAAIDGRSLVANTSRVNLLLDQCRGD